MNDPFEDKLLDWITSQKLTANASRVLLAVSGGGDSVAMVYALEALRRDGRLNGELAIGHVNHQLRGEPSDEDEAFVCELARRLEIPFASERANVKEYAAQERLSIETAARLRRLEILVRQCRALRCDAIATAHHLDDQAETMVHRLTRGTGFRGLCGIWPRSMMNGVTFIRPMLNVSKSEIEAYGRRKSLSWRQDATNDSLEPTRNRIRHVLLPKLRKDWPRVNEGLAGLSQVCRRMQEAVDIQASEIFQKALATRQENSLSLQRQVLIDCPPWVFYEVVREALVQLGIGLRDYSQTHFDKIRSLTLNGTGRHQFPGHVRVRAKSKTITISLFE